MMHWLRMIPLVILLLCGSAGLGGGAGAIPGTEVAAQVPTDDPELEIREYDIVELMKGGRLEGEILNDRIDSLEFRQKNGIVTTIPAADVKTKWLKNPPLRVYELRKRKYFDRESAREQWTLAQWCLEPKVGLTEQGIFHLEEATRLKPEEPSVYADLLELYRARSGATVEQRDREVATALRGITAGVGGAELAVHAARLLVELGDARAAILLLEPLAERDASASSVEQGQDLLIELLDRVGRRDTARTYADRFMVDTSRQSMLSLRRLSSEWLLADVAAGVPGAAEELSTSLDEILSQDATDGLAHLWRGSLAMLEGDTKAAEKAFQRAFELGQIGGVAIATRALNYAFAAEPNKALELISMARSSTGVAELVKQVEAYTQENLGDVELAAAILKELTDLDAPAWQSWVLAIQGRERLEEDFLFDREVERALDAVGSNEAAFAELALLRGDRALGEGRPADARRWLGYARSAGRNLPEVLLRVGLAQLEDGGDLRIAREALTRAVEAAPANPDIQNALGCLEYRTGALELARDRFQLVVDLVPEAKKSEEGLVVPARVYAIAALEQIDRALGEEVWVDEFERPNGPQVLNNWEKHETYGINIEIRDKAVLFEGTQAFERNGLTKLVRPIDSSQLARVRALLVIEPRTRGRIGLRLAREEGGGEGEGLVVFRDLDGMIAVALNASDPGEEPIIIRSDSDGEGLDNERELVPTEWPNDGEAHWLELRLPREEADESTASVYFDGALVLRGIPVPRLSRRGSTIVGVSVQADLDQRLRLEVEQIEIFRRRPKLERGGANR